MTDTFSDCPITLAAHEVLEYARRAISVLTRCWELDYDERGPEPREEIKQAGVLLDLYHDQAERAEVQHHA